MIHSKTYWNKSIMGIFCTERDTNTKDEPKELPPIEPIPVVPTHEE